MMDAFDFGLWGIIMLGISFAAHQIGKINGRAEAEEEQYNTEKIRYSNACINSLDFQIKCVSTMLDTVKNRLDKLEAKRR